MASQNRSDVFDNKVYAAVGSLQVKLQDPNYRLTDKEIDRFENLIEDFSYGSSYPAEKKYNCWLGSFLYDSLNSMMASRQLFYDVITRTVTIDDSLNCRFQRWLSGSRLSIIYVIKLLHLLINHFRNRNFLQSANSQKVLGTSCGFGNEEKSLLLKKND